MQRPSVQRSTVQRSTVQRSTVQRPSVQRSTVQRSTVQRSPGARREPTLTDRPKNRRTTDPGPVVDGVYRVDRVVGQGGMGLVLLARDERLQRDVAIKLIAEDLLERHGVRERFIAEAQAMAKVRHENVVQIYALGDHLDIPYFAMEYVPGKNLAEWIETHPNGPGIDLVLGIIEQVGRGLDAIHLAGNVHADVKPGNVLIGPSHRIALTDFGLARQLGAADDTGLVVGTPSYLPPEVIRPTTVLDARADVYSLGVVTYEMLTGELPYPIESIEDFFLVHRNPPPIRPLETFRSDLSPVFDEVIARALARAPDKRYKTAGAFAHALFDAREDLRLSAPGFRIVLADDDDAFRVMALSALEFAFPGGEIVAVDDGEKALRAIDAAPTDLAVLDLDMPGLNGVELTAAIRENSNVPVLVVTARGGATDWRLLQSIGADGFLVKPLEPMSLVASTRRILRGG
ncbi:MAG: serine/threonine-protein kinase [Myxococcota bacterium]